MATILELNLELAAAKDTIQRQQQEIARLMTLTVTLQKALTRPCIAMFTDTQLEILTDVLTDALLEGKKAKEHIN